ncbi:MAG: alanine--tRNA ligase [Patescibacteria group bacterium]|nr:alanine--tRNA ligase [Patescibacteria group bacterium]
MDSKTLRQKFIQFFVERGHKQVPSASLIPEDQSVLFTTAGMQQFKKFYTSPEAAPAKNVVTVQPCFRTSDIEEVGDNTHLTFFEMLGNFSFGGYFKKETIEMGYEFLTKELEIDPKRIYCSVFKGDEINPRDEESVEILEKMGLTYKEHSREDNFWGPTGEEGPCGPTVEFYVDNIEIWNLVFNEYYKEKSGKYRNLETKGVDTGMGLERMLVVVNKAENVFHTDLFDLPHKKLHQFLKKEDSFDERIILDHIKAAVFAINDDVRPSNKDRGYIVRRLIRRAIVKGNQIGIVENFIKKIAEEVFETYKGIYQFDQKMIQDELEKEETKFRNTLSNGLKEFEKQKQNLTGEIAFNLYQTYGFPWEMTAELAEENKINVDRKDFEKAFEKHQELSRTASAGMFKGGLADGGEMETKYHTATHLLLASLRQVLGPDVYQKGSNITAERLRFDFNWPEKLTDEQIKKVEDLVNVQIKKDLPVQMQEMTLEEAKESGAMGVFENKYGDKVKVYSIGDFSQELCGGPHVKSTGELGHFKITKEESSSAGIRRIKAILE